VSTRIERLSRFPRERTWLLPALQAIQHREGWLSIDALGEVADHLRVPRSEVHGVASHYPEFRLSPPGRRVIRVCTGVSCRIQGGLECLATLERRLGVSTDNAARSAITPDGEVTLEPLDCAFNCSTGPVIEVDGQQMGRVSPGHIERVLDTPAAGGPATHSGHAAPSAPVPPPGAGVRAAAHRAPPSADVASAFASLAAAARTLGEPARLRVGVSVSSCGLAAGAASTLAALTAEVGARGMDARVRATGCAGLCWGAPAVSVSAGSGPPIFVPRVTRERVATLLDAIERHSLAADSEVTAWFGAQRREIVARCGLIDPGDIAEAIRAGSYTALAHALADGHPEAVIETVKAARLDGRGGAYFPAALKWEAARRAAREPRYLIVNGEEGEPGIFKDRHLMEGDPHRLLEGALLAAYAAGASRIYLYVHGEAHLAARRLERAVEDARDWGLVGARILGSDFSADVEVRRGAGGFVLGEETALMESIEGRRAMPRAKPPFPTESGLWGCPTVINNVETLCAVPLVVERGAAWWTGLGGGRGTKCFGLSGHVRRPGLVEMEMGTTLRDLLERAGGGVSDGGRLQAVLVGGPSGMLVPPRRLDEPMLLGGAVAPGTGGIVALGEHVSLRDVVATLLDFNARESCGKCTPCREGTGRLREMLDAVVPPAPDAVAELCEVVRLASLCGLGQAAPLSILSALREFPDDFADLSPAPGPRRPHRGNAR
jgi:NADH:ubiquinone oxidoreductase subunit F (NADH-binding)/NADH:ubiquinone oxidoreductase subunit E